MKKSRAIKRSEEHQKLPVTKTMHLVLGGNWAAQEEQESSIPGDLSCEEGTMQPPRTLFPLSGSKGSPNLKITKNQNEKNNFNKNLQVMGLRWMLGKNLHTAYTARSKKL